MIYATSGEDYRYLLFTHKIEESKEDKYERLKNNIDPNDLGPCFVKKQFDEGHHTLFEEPETQYKLSEVDKRLLKKYKIY